MTITEIAKRLYAERSKGREPQHIDIEDSDVPGLARDVVDKRLLSEVESIEDRLQRIEQSLRNGTAHMFGLPVRVIKSVA